MSYPALPLRMHVHSDMAGAVEDVGMVRILTMQEMMEKECIQVESGQIWTRLLGDPTKFAGE